MSDKTNKKNFGKFVFATLLFAVHGMLFVKSLSYPLIAKIFPLLILIPLLILLGIEVLKDLRALRKASNIQGKLLEEGLWPVVCEETKAHLWILLMLLSSFVFGLILTAAFFPVVYMLSQKEKWKTIIGVAGGLSGGIYLLFIQILKIPLYQGWILERFLS